MLRLQSPEPNDKSALVVSVVPRCVHTTCLGRESKKDDLCDVQYKRKCDGKSDTIKRPYLDVVDILPSSKSSKTCVCD